MLFFIVSRDCLARVYCLHDTDGKLEIKSIFSDGLQLCSSKGRPVSFLYLPLFLMSAFVVSVVLVTVSISLTFALEVVFTSMWELLLTSLQPPVTLVSCFCSDLCSFKKLLAQWFTLIFCYSFSLICISLSHFPHIKLVLNNFMIFIPPSSLCVDNLLHLSG